MHFTLKGLVELLAQEWYVLCAYFAIFVLLEVRKNGEEIAMHRVVRHALWAGSFVILLHAAMVSAALIRRTGLDFRVFDYVMVMCLTGTTVYLLGERTDFAYALTAVTRVKLVCREPCAGESGPPSRICSRRTTRLLPHRRH